MNGLAVAPPAITFNVGVSTSKYPLLSNIFLISLIIFYLLSVNSTLSTSLPTYLYHEVGFILRYLVNFILYGLQILKFPIQ